MARNDGGRGGGAVGRGRRPTATATARGWKRARGPPAAKARRDVLPCERRALLAGRLSKAGGALLQRALAVDDDASRSPPHRARAEAIAPALLPRLLALIQICRTRAQPSRRRSAQSLYRLEIVIPRLWRLAAALRPIPQLWSQRRCPLRRRRPFCRRRVRPGGPGGPGRGRAKPRAHLSRSHSSSRPCCSSRQTAHG